MVRRTILVLLILSPLGCQVYYPPRTGPSRKEVLDVCKDVVLARHPMARALEKSDLVIARTPVVLDGAYKSCRQITVHVRQNYVGVWEPTVRVLKHIEVDEPPVAVDPQGDSPATAFVVARNRWKPLQYMSVEEAELQREIWSRLQERWYAPAEPDEDAAEPPQDT